MPAEEPARPASTKLVLTGQRREDRYRIEVDGKAVWLPCASLGVLVELVCAAIQSESGLAKVGRGTVYRLRKDIDAILGAGAAVQLIATGAGEEYGWVVPKSKIRARIGIAPCFYELVAIYVVTKEQAEILRKHCGKRKLRETDE